MCRYPARQIQYRYRFWKSQYIQYIIFFYSHIFTHTGSFYNHIFTHTGSFYNHIFTQTGSFYNHIFTQTGSRPNRAKIKTYRYVTTWYCTATASTYNYFYSWKSVGNRRRQRNLSTCAVRSACSSPCAAGNCGAFFDQLNFSSVAWKDSLVDLQGLN